MQVPPTAARWSRPAPTEAPRHPGVLRVRRLAVRHLLRPRASRDEAAHLGWMLHLFFGTDVPSPTRGFTSPVGKVCPLCALPRRSTMKSYDMSSLARDHGFVGKIRISERVMDDCMYVAEHVVSDYGVSPIERFLLLLQSVASQLS